MKILLINSYLGDTSRIGRLKQEMLRVVGEEPFMVHISEAHRVDSSKFDAAVISGGEAPLSKPEVAETFLEAATWIRSVRIPILGICFGHQLLGLAFGGRIAWLGRRFEGFYDVDIVEPDGVFTGLPSRIKVWKSNSRVVARVMPGFKLLAKSVDYEVEAFRHRERGVFGVQFHPENYSETYGDGRRVLENFISLFE